MRFTMWVGSNAGICDAAFLLQTRLDITLPSKRGPDGLGFFFKTYKFAEKIFEKLEAVAKSYREMPAGMAGSPRDDQEPYPA